LLLVSTSAWAKRRIAVTQFIGKGDAVQKVVQELVARDATVISDAAVKRTQRRLHIAELTDSNVARIAAELQADAIVQGSVQRTGVEWGLTITIIDGKTGGVSDTVSVALRSNKLDPASRRELADKLTPALAKVGGLGEDSAPVEVAPATAPAADTEAPPLAAPVKPAPTADETEAVTASDEGRYARSPAIDLDVGMSGVVRNLSFNYVAGLNPPPSGYKGTFVPSLLVTGALYPFAFGDRDGPLAGLGVDFVVEKVLAIKSRLESTTIEYTTSQLRWGAGLRYRLNFGAGATAPSLLLGAGYQRLLFTIDHGTDKIGLPDVTYAYLTLGGGGRVPLGTPNVALYADVRYLHVLSSGAIADADQYGGGTVRGLAAEAGLEVVLARRIILRAGARYQRIAFTFDGTGAMANNLDGDPSSQDVGGALDEYWSGFATGGYLF
jgi:hypothetical protein